MILVCPDGWSKFDLSCYTLVYKKLTWSSAEGYCNELGGHLASVHSSEENDFIFGLVDKQKVWIGANDLNTEGVWVWSDGSAFDYRKWRSGEPNNMGKEGENCGHLKHHDDHSKDWNDIQCSHTLNFVCTLLLENE